MTDTPPIEVSLVPAEYLDSVWPEVKGYMAEAAKPTAGRYTEQDIYNLIANNGYLLWIAFSTEGTRGAVVTCFLNYPQMRALHVMFLGGIDAPKWKTQMMSTLKAWAKDSGCGSMECSCRLEDAGSWARVFKDDGFQPLWQTYELAVPK